MGHGETGRTTGRSKQQGSKRPWPFCCPTVNAQKAHFKPQEIANLLWAMAKLVDNGQEQTPELKEAVAALLPQVIAQKANL